MTMTYETESPSDGSALVDFNDGFHDGWAGLPRKKNRSAGYRRAHGRGVALRRENDFGEDLGKFGQSPLRRKQT